MHKVYLNIRLYNKHIYEIADLYSCNSVALDLSMSYFLSFLSVIFVASQYVEYIVNNNNNNNNNNNRVSFLCHH